MLAEDLRSPCTEEVAVFQAFSKVIGESRRQFVVVDTAPTGHTLLLLDATGSYHREVARQLGDRHFTTPLMRLQDPGFTKVIIVTLAETTPVLEAAGLRTNSNAPRSTRGPGSSTTPWPPPSRPSPLLRRRAAAEIAQIATVRNDHSDRIAVVPLLAVEPVGIPALKAFGTARGALNR